jgi:hypothetical protein
MSDFPSRTLQPQGEDHSGCIQGSDIGKENLAYEDRRSRGSLWKVTGLPCILNTIPRFKVLMLSTAQSPSPGQQCGRDKDLAFGESLWEAK